jgi:hypothetical protein
MAADVPVGFMGVVGSRERRRAVQASVGDEIVVRGRRVGDEGRHAVILEVRGADGGPPYVVRWSNGHEGLFFPSSDATVEHLGVGGSEPAA